MDSAFTFKGYQTDAIRRAVYHVESIRDWDSDDQDGFEDRPRTVVLRSPTGSGKSRMGVAICAHLLDVERYGFSGALCLTVHTNIRDNFVEGVVATLPQSGRVAAYEIDLRDVANPVDRDVTNAINQHLHDPPTGRENRILVATHASAVRLWNENGGALNDVDWRRWVVFIDEAQFATISPETGEDDERKINETEIGKFTELVRRRGALILKTSAEPSRTNSDERVYPDGSEIVNVSYCDVVTEGMAPSRINVELVGPDNRYALKDVVARAEKELYADYHVDREEDGILSMRDAKQVARKWVEDGCQKSFVKVARVDDAKRILEAFCEVKPYLKREGRIFDATGDRAREKFQEILNREREKDRYEDSEVDVFVICGRGTLGTDWKFCSHMYCVGLPQSIRFILQLIGRALRGKNGYEDYPEAYKDVATITFFVPRMSEELATRVRSKWHSGAVLLACFIHSHETATRFSDEIRVRIRQKAREAGVTEREWATLTSIIDDLFPGPADMVYMGKIIAKLELLFKEQNKRPPRVPEVAEMILSHKRLDGKTRIGCLVVLMGRASEEDQKVIRALFGADIIRLFENILGIIISGGGNDGGGGGGGGGGGNGGGNRIRDKVGEELLKIFKGVASQFDHITSLLSEDIINVLSSFDGSDTERIERELRRNITERRAPAYLEILDVIDRWYKDHDGGRNKIHGDLSNYFGFGYSVDTLRRDLEERRSPGQPDYINSLDDVLGRLYP